MSKDEHRDAAALLEMAAAAMERAAEAQTQVRQDGLVFRVACVPHLNPAARVAMDERRLALDAITAAHRMKRRWFGR